MVDKVGGEEIEVGLSSKKDTSVDQLISSKKQIKCALLNDKELSSSDGLSDSFSENRTNSIIKKSKISMNDTLKVSS